MIKIIVAPHADDEIIGCWRVLDEKCVVVHVFPIILHRWREMVQAQDHFAFQKYPVGENGLLRGLDSVRILGGEEADDCVVLAPDPHWETHPGHKLVGSQAQQYCLRNGLRFLTYSTSMNTPYLIELSPEQQEEKRKALDTFYPSQKSLWECDHRYFLFEGLCEWYPSV